MQLRFEVIAMDQWSALVA